MPSDNNQEMFPVVDEQGNITGAALVENVIAAADCFIRLSTCTSSIPKESCIYKNVPNGKTSSPGNGIQP